MGERRFYLLQLRSDDSLHTSDMVKHTITESELIKRFYQAWNYVQCAGIPKDKKIVSILTHGEGEKWEGLIYEDALPEDMTDAEYDAWYAKSMVIDGVRMGPPFKPSPTPSREEWVKWVEKSPWKTDADHFKVFDWLLSMPCVPKE